MTDMKPLTGAELDQVCGGMDCQTAAAVAGVYLGIATILGAVGNAVASANASGVATGMIQASCPK